MEFNINKNDLVEPALLASNVSEKRQSIPILSNVLISAAKNSIKITATDLEIEYKTTIEGVEVKKEGEITVSARKLADLVRSIPEDTKLNFCLIDNQIEIKALKFQADLATLPVSDFPSIDSADFSSSIKISSSALADMIGSTSVAMAAQDVRYYLNGCLLETKGKALCVVSTDGHRLAFTKTSIDGLKEDFRVIVPRKAVMELQKIISTNYEEITLNVCQNQINVVGTEFSFTSKLIEGNYPDYEKVFPVGDESKLIVDKNEFNTALSRASVLSNEKYRGIRLSLNKDLLKIEANNPEKESAEEEIKVDYSGPELEIGFNISYLQESLTTIKDLSAEIVFFGQESSCIVKNKENEDLIHVIMPMRL